MCTGADTCMVYCNDCRQFVALGRIPYTQRFSGCPECAQAIDAVPVDEKTARCPNCEKPSLEFRSDTHVLMYSDAPPLEPGFIVDAELDVWSIKIPDMASVPIDRLDDYLDVALCPRVQLEVYRPTDSSELRFRIHAVLDD